MQPIKVIFKRTTSVNPVIQSMVNTVGILQKNGDRYCFTQPNENGFHFLPVKLLGNFDVFACDEMYFQTKNSEYTFERAEKYEKLFDYCEA